MINKIVTHFRPHADELIALMFLKNFPEGEAQFPGIRNAKIEFLSTGKLPEGKTYRDFPDTVFLGVGGGPFDEHETDGQERSEGEVCATLVAKALGIENKPELKGILDIVKDEDLNGAKEKDSLSVMIKFLHSCFKEDYETIYRWSELAYLAHIGLDSIVRPFTLESARVLLKDHKDFLWWNEVIEKALKYQDEEYQKALKEFDEKALKESIVAYDGKQVVFSFIESDNEEMGKAARSRMSQLIVQRNSRGNVFIFTYRKRNLDLTFVLVLLRLAEQHFNGEIQVKDTETLSQTGNVADIPWYLFYTKDSIFNGSLTTKDVPPTKIPKEKLISIIKEGVSKRF
jgi:hypothetical protein